jgi:glycosyltransferase involved in cell wall biosynthesis
MPGPHSLRAVSSEPADISLVVPSHNRADALRTNLPDMLRLEGVLEIIVVIERHTSDESPEVVEALGDERLTLIRNPGPPGLSASRNAGVAESSGAWILFGEDDCRFPPDYAVVLKREALAHDAQIAGAPWIHVDAGVDALARLAELRGSAPAEPRIDAHGGVPAETVETPFIPAPALIRRDVFDKVSFDEGYTGNAYRQETAFFVQAMRSGHRCILTPFTASYQQQQWEEGGARSTPLAYELSTLRNNWRFMRLHGDWMAERGYIPGKLRFQAAFTAERVMKNVRGVISARLARRAA